MTAGTPPFSRSAVSWTLHDEQEPQSPIATTAPSYRSRTAGHEGAPVEARLRLAPKLELHALCTVGLASWRIPFEHLGRRGAGFLPVEEARSSSRSGRECPATFAPSSGVGENRLTIWEGGQFNISAHRGYVSFSGRGDTEPFDLAGTKSEFREDLCRVLSQRGRRGSEPRRGRARVKWVADQGNGADGRMLGLDDRAVETKLFVVDHAL